MPETCNFVNARYAQTLRVENRGPFCQIRRLTRLDRASAKRRPPLILGDDRCLPMPYADEAFICVDMPSLKVCLGLLVVLGVDDACGIHRVAGRRAAGVDVRGSAAPGIHRAPSIRLSDQVVNQYCAGCHNERSKTSAAASGVILERADLSRVAEQSEMWEKVVRRLRAGAMPPAGLPRPDAATHDRLVSFLERRSRSGAVAQPEAWPRLSPPPESSRVRQRGPRPAGPRGRRVHACCRRTIRRTASTTTPTCSASHLRCWSAISRRRRRSARWRSAARRSRRARRRTASAETRRRRVRTSRCRRAHAAA